MLKSIRLLTLTILTATMSLVLPFASGTAAAQSQRRAVASMHSDGASLSVVPGTVTPVWVDTVVKTFIEGWTEYNPDTCADISTGTIVATVAAKHGTLFYDVENGTLDNGDCPGMTFPFSVVRYTWTDASQAVLKDPFTLKWTTPDGEFTEVDSFSAQLAKITQPKSLWWSCGAAGSALPDHVSVLLTNPPSGATSYVWAITAGAASMVYSNNTATITTSTNTAGVKAKAASTAMNDVSMNVVVNGLTYFFMTDTRSPHQLKRRTDLDQDNGRGASCAVAGTLGWQSLIGYEVDDQFGVNTSSPDNANAGVNEKFGTKTNSQANNYPIPTEGGSGTTGGLFNDNMCITTTAFTPNPLPPQSPLTTNLVDRIGQTWFGGSSATPPPNKGCKVSTDSFTRYIDHGRHLNIVSPAALPAETVAQTSSVGSASGYPMPVPNVRYLADQSSVIVKGRVLQVSELGTTQRQTENGALTFHRVSASFQVDSVLKGNVGAKIITVEFLQNPNVLALTLENNEYALLFLTSSSNGSYQFADPQVGKMAITNQIVPSAESAKTTEGKLEAELIASLSDPDHDVAWTALKQIGNLGSVRSTQALREIATTGTPEFQGLAYAALLRLGDYSLLNRAIRFAEEPGQDLETQRLQSGVEEAIGDITDKSALPVLNSLLASPNVNLRRAATKSLRGMTDPSSAGFLVGALDDRDGDVRYNAMMALAALAGASPDNAPARDIFDQNPAKYLNNWKSWWETSGKQKYGASH